MLSLKSKASVTLASTFTLIIFIIGFGCDNSNPISTLAISTPAAKISTKTDNCLVIEWDCKTDETEYTILWKNYQFLIDGERIRISQYLDSQSRLEYWVDETPKRWAHLRDQATIQVRDGMCGFWSNAITDTTAYPQIYPINLRWQYRESDYPRYSGYWKVENEEKFFFAQVAVDPDTTVVPVLSNDYDYYYLPTNLDTLAWENDGSQNIFPWLRSPFCTENCDDWEFECFMKSEIGATEDPWTGSKSSQRPLTNITCNGPGINLGEYELNPEYFVFEATYQEWKKWCNPAGGEPKACAHLWQTGEKELPANSDVLIHQGTVKCLD